MDNRIFLAMQAIMSATSDLTQRCIHCRGDVLCEACETDKAAIYDNLVTIINVLEPIPEQRVALGLDIIE